MILLDPRPILRRMLDTDRLLRVLRRAGIALGLAAAAGAVAYFGIVKPRLVIDRLAARARPELALPGPVVAAELQGVELALEGSLRGAAASEDASVSKADRLAVINRWTREIYPRFGSFMLACALDPPTIRIARELSAGTPAETAARIRAWAAANLLHTQGQEVFEDMPGDDPWGALNVFEPAYGKVLPSELVAKSIYTGRMTGKCCSLAAFITGLFAWNGAGPEDIVVFRLRSHVVGMVRFAGSTYLVSNQRVDDMDSNPKVRDWVEDMPYRGFFGYPFGAMRDVRVEPNLLRAPEGPLAYVAAAAGASDLLLALASFPKGAFEDREALSAAVFGASAEPALARAFTLARYAYQSLYVRDPGLYLEASVREPTVRELSRRLKTEEQVIRWIRDNVSYGPIFEDHAERIMTADQVIVYRKGTLKDQALLFAALRERCGHRAVVAVTRDGAYVQTDGRTWEARGWSVVERLPEDVEIRLAVN